MWSRNQLAVSNQHTVSAATMWLASISTMAHRNQYQLLQQLQKYCGAITIRIHKNTCGSVEPVCEGIRLTGSRCDARKKVEVDLVRLSSRSIVAYEVAIEIGRNHQIIELRFKSKGANLPSAFAFPSTHLPQNYADQNWVTPIKVSCITFGFILTRNFQEKLIKIYYQSSRP